jgi:hypothetical protein
MEEEDWLKFGVAAALSRSYAEDQRAFLKSLAATVQNALPGHVGIVRGGLFGLGSAIRELRIDLGEERYVLHDPGRGSLVAQRALVKRGIVLRTDPVPVEQWIQELGDALQAHARTSEEAARALRRFVE